MVSRDWQSLTGARDILGTEALRGHQPLNDLNQTFKERAAFSLFFSFYTLFLKLQWEGSLVLYHILLTLP